MEGFVFTISIFLVFLLLMLFLIFYVKGKLSKYLTAITVTVSAWFIGLILDANIGFEPVGFLSLRLLFPVLAMGLYILNVIMKNKSD